jgi:hypothetical protein
MATPQGASPTRIVADHEPRGSWPRTTPAEGDHASFTWFALPVVIWSRGLKRVFA